MPIKKEPITGSFLLLPKTDKKCLDFGFLGSEVRRRIRHTPHNPSQFEKPKDKCLSKKNPSRVLFLLLPKTDKKCRFLGFIGSSGRRRAHRTSHNTNLSYKAQRAVLIVSFTVRAYTHSASFSSHPSPARLPAAYGVCRR